MVVATMALIIAVTGTAVATSRLVNGDKLIEKASLSGNRLRKHTLTGTQINLAKLGKIPSATNADSATQAISATHASAADSATHASAADSATHASSADSATNASTLGGVPASGYLQTANVLQGAVDANTPGGARIFLDPGTGADVRYFGNGRVEIVNTNTQDDLGIHGISEIALSVTPNPQTVGRAANARTEHQLPQQTINPNYLDLIVIRIGATATQAVALHLTCGVASGSTAVALTCVGVR